MSKKSVALQSIREEGADLIRGAAGGFIFGTPLLFTMEMWFHGMRLPPEHLLEIVAFTFLINVCFSYASGLRQHNKDHTPLGALADSITALALGIIIAILILGLIGQLNSANTWDVILGKIVIEACAVSLGVTFTNTKFPRKGKGQADKNYKELEAAPLSDEQKQARLDFQNMAAVIGGAVVFSFNVAPTEEIVLIGSSLNAPALLVLFFAQIFICYIILYAAEFKEKKVFKKNVIQSPIAEIIMTVAMAWLISALMIFLIGSEDAKISIDIFIASTLTLGLPAVIGGAAGKVIV